jgi:3-oxoacyl-[acyl-carrier-protein] synthase I
VEPLILSGATLTTCLGAGLTVTRAALAEGYSGLRACQFEDAALTTYVGEAPGVDAVRMPAGLEDFDCRNNRLAFLALRQDGFMEAVARARERYGAQRIAVLLGTSTSGVLQAELAYRRRDPGTDALPADFHYATTHDYFSLGDFVRRVLDLAGPAHVTSTACSSSAKVFASAARMIAAGVVDAAVVGGVDSLCLTTLYGFNALELLSHEPCRPFDAQRSGLSLGEAGGFALLERREAAPDPDAITLLGYGESNDAYHMSTPHPDGLGATLAMQRALASAGLAAPEIGYINFHGTASKANDTAEDRAVYALFGDRVPCSATKGATGHALGAAGIAEALIACTALEQGILPGTVNTRTVDPTCHSNVLLEAQPCSVRAVLSNSFGFGGSNCSLIFGRPA